MKPLLALYCQHHLGMGHWTRSVILAEALSDKFDVVFLNGNHAPAGARMPREVQFEHLPALSLDENFQLISGEPSEAIESVLNRRAQHIQILLRRRLPDVLLVELYPFGRKKFGFELDPLIAAVKSAGGQVICSVRDVLVTSRKDQAAHDLRAARKLNASFDAVIVHGDPAFARFEDTFRPSERITIPIHYSGFVVPSRRDAAALARSEGTLVSAGGGMVGLALYRAALKAQPLLFAQKGWAMTLVAGPLLPEEDWRELVREAAQVPATTLRRSVPDLGVEMSAHARSVSQCGYNTALDILFSRTPSVIVPFARGRETEQSHRAMLLKERFGLSIVTEAELSPEALIDAIMNLTTEPLARTNDIFDGADRTVRLIEQVNRAGAEKRSVAL